MNPHRNRLRSSIPGLLALAILLGRPAAGRAGFVVEVASFTAQAGSTGSFDVVLRNEAPTTALRVSSSTVQIGLTGAPGVQFTAASIATAAATPYLYVQSSTTVAGGLPLSLDPFPNSSFTASDSEFGPLGYRLVNSGAVFGLVHVTYAVATSAAPGVRSFAIDLAGTSFSDDGGNPLAFTTRAGTVTVNAGSVPEPASITLVGVGAVGVIVLARRSRSNR